MIICRPDSSARTTVQTGLDRSSTYRTLVFIVETGFTVVAKIRGWIERLDGKQMNGDDGLWEEIGRIDEQQQRHR